MSALPPKADMVSAFCGRSLDAQDRPQPAIRLSRKDRLLRTDRAVLCPVLGAGCASGPCPAGFFAEVGLRWWRRSSMDPRRAPQRIGNAHLADQLADLQRHNRPATSASRLPAPIRPETRAMPANNGIRLNDRQRIANSRKQPIEPNEYQSVDGTEGEFLWSSPP
jgi:hypothetical protein